jgi:hypothetical protein
VEDKEERNKMREKRRENVVLMEKWGVGGGERKHGRARLFSTRLTKSFFSKLKRK